MRAKGLCDSSETRVCSFSTKVGNALHVPLSTPYSCAIYEVGEEFSKGEGGSPYVNPYTTQGHTPSHYKAASLLTISELRRP